VNWPSFLLLGPDSAVLKQTFRHSVGLVCPIVVSITLFSSGLDEGQWYLSVFRVVTVKPMHTAFVHRLCKCRVQPCAHGTVTSA